MRKRLVLYAVIYAITNSIVVGYLVLHSHDELDANDTTTAIPFRSGDDSFIIDGAPDGIVSDELGWPSDKTISLPIIGVRKEGDVLQKDGFGGLTWGPDTIHSEAYGSYPAEVPFEQGMTLFPGQSATITLPTFFFSDTTYAEFTESELHFLLENTKIDSTK